MRHRRIALGMALAMAMLVGPMAGAVSAATPTDDPAPCDGHWPTTVQGVPTLWHAGARTGDYIWHDSRGWHLRVTHPGTRLAVFTGRIRAGAPMTVSWRPARGARSILAQRRQEDAQLSLHELRAHRRARHPDRVCTVDHLRRLGGRQPTAGRTDRHRQRQPPPAPESVRRSSGLLTHRAGGTASVGTARRRRHEPDWSRAASRRSTNGICVSFNRLRASAGADHSTRSISGTVIQRPDLGGHSNGNVLLCAVGRVEIAFERPRDDELAALLTDLAQVDRRPVGRRVPGLLGELAAGDLPFLLAGLDLTLGHGPHAGVALRPDGTAGMREQDLEAGRAAAIQEDAGTPPGGRHAPLTARLIVETSGRCGRGAPARTSVRLATGCRSARAAAGR